MNRKAGIWGDVQPNNMMTADVGLQWTTGKGGGGGGVFGPKSGKSE